MANNLAECKLSKIETRIWELVNSLIERANAASTASYLYEAQEAKIADMKLTTEIVELVQELIRFKKQCEELAEVELIDRHYELRIDISCGPLMHALYATPIG